MMGAGEVHCFHIASGIKRGNVDFALTRELTSLKAEA
jgi:hypothetical protein